LLQKILCRTVTIQVDTYWPFTYIKLTVTGQTNQVKLDGTYKTGDGTLDMNLDIAKLSKKYSRLQHGSVKRKYWFCC
jgi:hypothetical protein